MPLDLDPVLIIYALVAGSVVLFVEAIYLVFFAATSYRNRVNRRLRLIDGQPDRESILVQIRRERGLTAGGLYSLPILSLNRLVLQSGLTMGLTRFLLVNVLAAAGIFAVALWYREDLFEAAIIAAGCGVLLPFVALKFMRSRRHSKFGAQFPRRPRHDRAQPARRPSGPGRHRHGGARDARSGRY